MPFIFRPTIWGLLAVTLLGLSWAGCQRGGDNSRSSMTRATAAGAGAASWQPLADTIPYRLVETQVLGRPSPVPDTDTTRAVVIYPEVTATAFAWLTDSVKAVLATMAGVDENGTPYRMADPIAAARRFVANYDAELARPRPDDPEAHAPLPWSLTLMARPMATWPWGATVEVATEQFAGGAHGNRYLGWRHYDRQGRRLSLTDMLDPEGGREHLLKVAEEAFRRQEGLGVDEPLAERYFFENGQFALPNEFTMTKQGLVLFYNIYEVQPYAAGPLELTLPASAVARAFRPEFRP